MYRSANMLSSKALRYSVMRQDSWIIPFGMKSDMTCEGEVCLSISFNLELSCLTSFITESLCLIPNC